MWGAQGGTTADPSGEIGAPNFVPLPIFDSRLGARGTPALPAWGAQDGKTVENPGENGIIAYKDGGEDTGRAAYNAYLKMLDELEQAKKSGITARMFAMSKGVPSSLTDKEAALLDKYNLKMFTEGAGKGSGDLNWDKVVSKKGETRIDHVNRHSASNPQRTTHGVFNGNPQDIVNQAWKNKGNIVPIDDGMGGKIYNIPYKNAGYESGSMNTGAIMDYITIIVMDGTNDIITAFPSFGDYMK